MIRLIRENARQLLLLFRFYYLSKVWGVKLSKTSRVSFSAFLDKTHPKGICIGEKTLVARGAVVLSHDFSRGFRGHTRIGHYCLIGANAIVLPGVTIGDHVVVGAGAVVTKDVESNSLVVGNPARKIREIKTTDYGKILHS